MESAKDIVQDILFEVRGSSKDEFSRGVFIKNAHSLQDRPSTSASMRKDAGRDGPLWSTLIIERKGVENSQDRA